MTDVTPDPRPASSRKKRVREMTGEEKDARDDFRFGGFSIFVGDKDGMHGYVAHHAIYAQKLRGRGFRHLIWDKRNRVIVEWYLHETHHHSARGPFIPRSALPDSVWAFALELDGGDLEGYFTDWIYRNYPVGEVEEGAKPGELTATKAVSQRVALATSAPETVGIAPGPLAPSSTSSQPGEVTEGDTGQVGSDALGTSTHRSQPGIVAAKSSRVASPSATSSDKGLEAA
jgi:hypothetical protein